MVRDEEIMTNLVGKTLKNRYRVEAFLGRGGMADVYKVWDTRRGVPLAMKVLREDLAEDIVFMRRFEREAVNLTRLQHPNIVRCYGLEREGRTAFMLMDYIDGWTLRSEIFDAHGPLSMPRILEVIQPVCSALSYAHQMGMVHCDVKSANIMIHKNGTVYLTDFGIARGMDAATSTMVGVGTPAYMAPELIKGEDPTPQTDIYALGIVLYEMLTGGERPFTGERATITGTTAEKVRWEHLILDPIQVTQFAPETPTSLEAVINCAIAKKIQDRYKNAMDFLQSVDAAIPQELRTVGSMNVGKPSMQSYHTRESSTDEIPDQGSVDRTPNLVVIIAAAVIGLGILIALLNGGKNNSSHDTTTASNAEQANLNSSSGSSSMDVQEPDIWFGASKTSVTPGECTEIFWDIENAEDVNFNGQWVTLSGSSTVCPNKTTTYEFIVFDEDGDQLVRVITINVAAKAATKTTSSKTPGTCIGYANDDGVNIRKDANGVIIGCCLGPGDKVTIYEVDSTHRWGRIKSERGHQGWVYLDYINISGSCDLLH